MSRMFSVLGGGQGEVSTAPGTRGVVEVAPSASDFRIAPDDDAAEGDGDAPFVEIGGPSGPVYSPTAAPARKTAPDSPASTATPPRTFPRLVDAPAYLSVSFHDLAGRSTSPTPVDGPDPGLVALHLPAHPVSGEYRTLRDEVRQQLPEPTPRVLMFAAAARQAGTTTVLLNLAVTLAREGVARVLVVDGNHNRPAVTRMLAAKPAPGLADVLDQRVPLAWAVQPSVVPNLQVLGAGDGRIDPGAVGDELPRLLGQLREWYDWVLVDAGVWGEIPERDAACPAADAVYLVTRAGDAERSEFTGLCGWVRELGGLLRGYIATRT